MAENSLIGWTHHTFNPWMGCVKVSDGCKHCYAETLITGRMGKKGLWGPASTAQRQVTTAANWRKPIKWNDDAKQQQMARRVFSASLADVFEDHPTANLHRPLFWQLVRNTPFLHWQILTKRPDNIVNNLPDDWDDGYPNVWLGTSIEDMRVARRADILREIPAAVRFISYEPALGPLDDLDITGIDWMLYGGESGPGYRMHDVAWARSMRRRCDSSREVLHGNPLDRGRVGAVRLGDYAGTTFFYKQSAAPRTEMGIELDGAIVRNYPTPRRVGRTLTIEESIAYDNASNEDIMWRTDHECD